MLLRESVSGSKHWLRKLSTTGFYLCSMMSLGCHNLFFICSHCCMPQSNSLKTAGPSPYAQYRQHMC